MDTWDALADEATYVCSSQNRVQSFTYGANCELPLSFIKPVTGLIETFDAAYEGEDTATQAIENVYSSYDQIMMNAAGFQVDERAYNDGKVPADIAGGIIMGILLDQLTSGMSFFSTSPIDELADGALSTARSELAGSVDELADSTLSTSRSELAGSVEGAETENIVNDVLNAKRAGNALKTDEYHAFNDIVDNYAGLATKTQIDNGTLYQLEGSLNGVEGRFEWIIDSTGQYAGQVSHRYFVSGGILNGVPIKP